MKYVYLLSWISLSQAIDLQLDRIQCDESLPSYALDDDITFECDGSSRCTFGQTATLYGNLYYQNMKDFGLSANSTTTGYATANLKLLTHEFDLFGNSLLPFNFCGEWVTSANENSYKYSKYNQYKYQCPQDGRYHFEIQFTLPENHDATTWFATGWEGVSYFKIYQQRSKTSPLLAHCKFHFKTYVSQSNDDGWASLPSAAKTTVVLSSILSSMLVCLTCLACRRRETHEIDDDDYEHGFHEIEEGDLVEVKDTRTEKSEKTEKTEKSKEEDLDWDPVLEKAHKFARFMKYQQSYRQVHKPPLQSSPRFRLDS